MAIVTRFRGTVLANWSVGLWHVHWRQISAVVQYLGVHLGIGCTSHKPVEVDPAKNKIN